jgi:hypothetical protein
MTQEIIYSKSIAIKPLAVILNTSGKDAVSAGSTFTISVTIGNKGSESAVIEVSIEDISQGIKRWCTSFREYLALGSNQSDEVIFNFQVPYDIQPGTYEYMIVVDAQEHYPEYTPIRYEQYIQVLPPTSNIVVATEPTFLVQPTTTPAQPALIPQGGTFVAQVLVQNRGLRVDRFHLVCSDLPLSWFTITYPQGFQGEGLVIQPDSLNLNPGEGGIITLVVTPPFDAIAGNYVPTLQLFSENHQNLVLLDLIHLHIPQQHLLQTELRTLIGRIQNKSGFYQVRLTNSGNIHREVSLHVKDLDESDICKYTLEETCVLIPPHTTVDINLKVKPDNKWKRPLIGGAKVINFNIDLEDTQQLPIPNSTLPGVLLWETRPWWQLIPILILALLGIGASAYLIWWFLFRVPPPPKILDFYSEDNSYEAINNDVVHLGFSISDANRVQTLKITGMSVDGKPLTRPEEYDLSQGLPELLKPFCKLEKSILTCRNFRTSARLAANYVFEMTIIPKPERGASSETRKTNPVAILPIPIPQVIALSSTQPIYQEVSDIALSKDKNKKQANSEISLNWSVINPKQLKQLQLVGRAPDGVILSPIRNYDFSESIPAELKAYCKLEAELVCKNVRTGIKKPGDYVFAMTALPQGDVAQKIEPKLSELIKIIPRPPQILDFKINGKPAQIKYFIPISTQPDKSETKAKVKSKAKDNNFIIFSWNIDTSEGSQVQLLPAPGNILPKGSMKFNLDPKPSIMTLILQVTNSTGQQVTRSVIIETYDPNPKDPAATAAQAVADTFANAQKQATEAQKQAEKAAASATKANNQAPSKPNTSTSDDEDEGFNSTPPVLKPVEQAPQLDRGIRQNR